MSIWYALGMHPEFIGKKVYINLSAALLQQVDDLAKHDYISRSALIRMAVLEYVRKPDNAAKLTVPPAKPVEDVELQQFLANYQKTHPDVQV